MEKLTVIEEKGLQDVHVFQLCECDAVAAYSLDEAITWYKEQTGVEDDELYDYEDIVTISLDYKVRNSEDDSELITVKEIINTNWNGSPFVALTTEW